MNQSDIDRIKTYIAAATPGPWRFALAYKKEHYGPLVAAVAPGHHIQAENCSGGTYPNRDAEFIAQARTDLPAAIAEIERLRRLCGEAEHIISVRYGGVLDQYAHQHDDWEKDIIKQLQSSK